MKGQERAREISLVAFKTKAEVEKYISDFPSACFELSYAMSPEFLSEVTPIIKDRVVSLHACCPREPVFPNFASHDKSVVDMSFDLMKKSAETANRFGAKIIVLHPGYLLDYALPSSSKARLEMLNTASLKRHIGFEKGSICNSGYLSDSEYREYFLVMKENLVELNQMLLNQGITLVVENLNPRSGYLFMSPEEMAELALDTELHYCLDVGHLYVSSFVFGFDFLSGVRKALSTGRVASVHLHSNKSGNGEYIDSHEDFFAPHFPAKKIVDDVVSLSSANLVIETLENPLANSVFLESLL
jgi:Endonuclease IV